MKNFRQKLLYLLPIVIFFSYYPLFFFGADSAMNYEISIPLIWLVLFSIISIIDLSKNFKFSREIVLISLIPIYATLSIFWSANPLRGILTAGILWLLFIAALSIYRMKNVVKNTTFANNIIKIFFIATSVICAFCWLQCFLDIFGVSREVTLLCAGCTSWSFGFPHPNGFAIEPQFMGNLLLAPTLLSLYLSFHRGVNKKYLCLFAFFSATLFLTFSRGAIYAFGIAFVYMLIKLISSSRKAALAIPVILCSFLLALFSQGIFAQVSPTTDTFYSGIAKSVHHLSLGQIDFRVKQETVENSEQKSAAEQIQTEQPEHFSTETEQDSDSAFDGYVEESTNIRLSLNEQALVVWSSSAKNIFFGVGLGGAGTAIANHYNSSAKEIVQNEYFSLLLELGLVGITIILLVAGILLKAFCHHPHSTFLLPLLLAYALTLLFFSGLPNALHIYLLPVLFFSFLPKTNLS